MEDLFLCRNEISAPDLPTPRINMGKRRKMHDNKQLKRRRKRRKRRRRRRRERRRGGGEGGGGGGGGRGGGGGGEGEVLKVSLVQILLLVKFIC